MEDTAPDAWGGGSFVACNPNRVSRIAISRHWRPSIFSPGWDDEARVGVLCLFDPQSETYLHTGGTHPKSKVLDTDGWLALSKFPS